MITLFSRETIVEQMTNGMKLKDVSDWIKILVLLATMVAGYVSLRDQVNEHTNQLEQVKDQIGEMRKENQTRNYDMQRKVGAIQMYLCSKDSTHCTPDNNQSQ
jgi:hypothetical protein